MTDLSELDEWVKGQRRLWIQRIKVENPDHAQYYCPTHGNYIGYNNFSSCQECAILV